LTAKLLSEYKQQIRKLTLVPSGGGCFELKADGELLYSKLETGQFPDEQAVVEMIAARLRAGVPSR
jgi:selenoprotein W-related protein